MNRSQLELHITLFMLQILPISYFTNNCGLISCKAILVERKKRGAPLRITEDADNFSATTSIGEMVRGTYEFGQFL